MTAILMQRSKDPVTCMACGRLAIGLGVHEPKKPVHAWICSPACFSVTRTLTTMNGNNLTKIERDAVEAAAQSVSEAVLNEVMGAIWDAGVRDLSAATPEQVTQAIGALNAGPMAGQVEAALIAFGASVKQQLADGVCPF